MAHETAHVARGHWNLRINEPEYSFERNVVMNCEIQADSTAVKWLINELLYDTIDGNPHSPVLAYTKKRLIYLWSIRIFSAYLSLSWGYREEERIWTVQTIENFRANKGLTHPIYQFRVFCLLNHAQYHLYHMAHSVDKEHPLWTADHYKVDEQIYKEVWRRRLDMVYSFEASFYIDWKEDERTTEQKIEDALHIKKYCHPDTAEEVPFMIGYMEEARAELEEYESQWPEIFDKLKKYGMYFVM
ncbi:MAG: hypothetical protein LUG99_17385 [Lachnospiraceae bacterium]|nr:hypothetical protein [Lachnospiraceae bacterium]